MNPDFLAKVVDPNGITVGVDAPKMSARQFKNELTEKRGVYCVIFDASCIHKDSNNSTTFSLRGVLARHRVKMSLSSIEGAPQAVAVAVETERKPKEKLFTLIYSFANSRYVLQQIEYW
jgi:hypothetical protein